MEIQGRCQTTAMGIMPHTDIDAAMKLAFTFDIPFWPQLPKISFYEDMYVQASQGFPGIIVDEKNARITLDTGNFFAGLEGYFINSVQPDFFQISAEYSKVYHQFLHQPDLFSFHAIRGHLIGPVSFGMKIVDEHKKPIIYHDEIKVFLYDFIKEKVNAQYRELQALNPNAFVWLDEPGLNIIFGSFTGYPAEIAREDYRNFLAGVEGPKGVHLCGNIDWSFLLTDVPLDIISLDIFANGKIFTAYTEEIKQFLTKGGIISWGLVPTLTEELAGESIQSMKEMINTLWNFLHSRGIPRQLLAEQAWFAPARCCLVNNDGAASVTRAYEMINTVAAEMKKQFGLA